ncbi:ARM repeat superfamily protein isoform X2 [Tasmannia lanceolata]|uniref:ARM repeat superfamily protein isoform X2 n=1 Tax=Tasmannia lanceolata TaxID=3420 RepID=UPI00406468C8
MRRLASQLRTYLFGKNARNSHTSQFSSFSRRDELSIEEEAERKVGWLLKLIFAGTASYVAYQFFPYMDERRMKIVEIGGAQQLLNMLEDAKDDRTRKEALKALVALSFSDAAVGVLHQAGAIPILNSTEISQDVEVVNYKSSLLKRLHGKK